jgi:PAS domain S-box-containing protein
VPSPRVLLVEDNLALAENVAEILEEEGISVVQAANGERALAKASGVRVDLAIIDVRLPDMSGLQLLSELRRVLVDAEYIIVTGNATLDTAIAAVREGVFAYVQKPFDPFDLVALARRALAQVDLRRERSRLAHELERSEKLHRGVFEAVESVIIGLDHQGQIQMWSRYASASLGYEASEVMGARILDLLTLPGSRVGFEDWLARAWGERVEELQIALRGQDGERTIRFVQASVIVNGSTLLLLVGQDVTDRLALEKRAADAEAMASLATLTAGLAHEIRNPLNAAILQLELLSRISSRLEETRARERIGESVKLVQTEIKRLSKLLEEFLSLARPRSFEVYPIDVGAVLDHVVSMQAPVAEAAGVTVAARTTELPRIYGDQSKLMQVFVNLLVNAIDALREGGRGSITIDAAPDEAGSMLLVRVADDGPGVPAEVAPQLFRPFFSTKAQGTGLGLAIVKRIVDLHGGTIAVRPRDGGGTVVEVGLRIAAED